MVDPWSGSGANSPAAVENRPYAVIRHDMLEAVVVDNRAVDDAVLPGHQAGYGGLAALRWRGGDSLFVPSYAGLNLEHIHDGTMQTDAVLYEPRCAPLRLRMLDERTAELDQAPTPHWKLESRTRFTVLDGNAIEMSFACVPHGPVGKSGYLGLFWASYLQRPESTAIHFRGPAGWVRGETPAHGVDAVHRGRGDSRTFGHEPALARRLELLFGHSPHRYAEPWFFGVHHGRALAHVFRAADDVRFTQSPTGGGPGNPAWDFQWHIESPQPGQEYRFVMRLVVLPYVSPDQVHDAVRPHLDALAQGPTL